VYADRFRRLGAASVRITGTMKFDTAEVTDKVAGTDDLAADLQFNPAAPLWVCGSTGPGEEALLLAIYRDLLATFPTLQLALIPRKPERFDEVAALITSQSFGLVRRSSKPGTYADAGGPTVILGDTMGELRKFYSLATVVFVGRTLVDLGPRQHGSDMIEPAALAKPTVVGPYTSNFAEVMRAFLGASAMLEVTTPDQLRDATARLLADSATAVELGRRAQQVVITGRGATARNLEAVAALIDRE
jgi:3-deoxy-D-manno-octulosonic-acid transferase